MKIKKSQLKKLIESYLYEQEDEVPPGTEDEGAPPDDDAGAPPDDEGENEEPPESEEPPEEETEEKVDDIEKEEIKFKGGKLYVTFRDMGTDEIKVEIKDENDSISPQLKPEHGSAILVSLFAKADSQKNEKLKKSVIHFIKKYHTDLDSDSNDLQVLEWIKTKQVRFTKFWIDEINSILKNRKNKKSIS